MLVWSMCEWSGHNVRVSMQCASLVCKSQFGQRASGPVCTTQECASGLDFTTAECASASLVNVRVVRS